MPVFSRPTFFFLVLAMVSAIALGAYNLAGLQQPVLQWVCGVSVVLFLVSLVFQKRRG